MWRLKSGCVRRRFERKLEGGKARLTSSESTPALCSEDHVSRGNLRGGLKCEVWRTLLLRLASGLWYKAVSRPTSVRHGTSCRSPG